MPQDLLRGVELLEEAVAGNSSDAMFNLGCWLVSGVDLPGGDDSTSVCRRIDKSEERGCRLLKQAAGLGHKAAEEYLVNLDYARCRVNSRMSVNVKEARIGIKMNLPFLLGAEERADQGDIQAQYEVGMRCIAEPSESHKVWHGADREPNQYHEHMDACECDSLTTIAVHRPSTTVDATSSRLPQNEAICQHTANLSHSNLPPGRRDVAVISDHFHLQTCHRLDRAETQLSFVGPTTVSRSSSN